MLEFRNLTRAYELGGERAGVFDVSLQVPKGCLAVLAGPSGSGKTTLLQLAGLLDTPDEGEVLLDGESVSTLPERARCDLRLRRMGFVFQAFNLVPVLSALENVMLPLQFQGTPETEARQRAEMALDRVGLADRRHHRPGQLSGGQQQRAAIARALAPDPLLVLADEPTASLDHAHGGPLMDLMAELATERGVTFLVASHDPAVIARAHQVFRLRDGRLAEAS
ncbi:ABC transporter ATP-binding protein [Geothrix limicola]|uniref:ABC transporter ATP-binding protein n=1 Tax=Geothrix limicola TaxID=2927978 RepID=A0ABQ5QKA4_9BACT|nr:ABC transporter ATP-binding protein [Geothrix limicola]GLH74958.1 ABC transporter ATP-binding protein [Geothrix limicola]